MTQPGDVLLCLRVTDLSTPQESSTTVDCGRCGQQVWISPNGLAMVATGAKVMCIVCATTAVTPDSEVLGPDGGDIDAESFHRYLSRFRRH